MDNNILQTFWPNEKGRDFVIGDVHGALSVFKNLLTSISFDPEVDRMFSVGDLCDRGPDSLGALSLLQEPWFHAVKANHEQMMYEAFEGGPMGMFWAQNGGTWGAETLNVAKSLRAVKEGRRDTALMVSDDDMKLLDILVLIEKLPYLITLNHKNGQKFHIIHAELPPNFGITDEVLADPVKVHALATHQCHDGDYFLWGRYRFLQFYAEDLSNRAKIIRTLKNEGVTHYEGLSHIISGHTPVQRPFTMLGQTNIDTYAVGSYGSYDHSGNIKIKKWCALTCINLDTWEFYQATETDFRKAEPFVINKADLS